MNIARSRAAREASNFKSGPNISRRITQTAEEIQATLKSVRRQVDKLNRRGLRPAGREFRTALANGNYGLAGTIAHRRMFKRLRSRDFRTTSGQRIVVNRQPVYPPPGQASSFAYAYRLPDVQYGLPGSSTYIMWDFKSHQSSPLFSDPTGQFRDLSFWTGVSPIPLYYHW